MTGRFELDSEVEKLSEQGLPEFVLPTVNVEEIGADFVQAEKAQSELETASKSIEQILTDLESLRKLMGNGAWLGKFAETYLDKIEKMQVDIEQIPPYIKAVSDDIMQYSEAIKKISEAYS